MLEQWVMHLAFQNEVLGSTLGLKNWKAFFLQLNVTVVRVKHYNLLHEDYLTILSTNLVNKAKKVKTVDNRLTSWTDMFNKHTVSLLPDEFEADAKTTLRNLKHA